MRIALALSLALMAPALAQAANSAGGDISLSRAGSPGSLGLGLGLGSPTSLNGKYFLDSKLALDFGLDFVGARSGFGLHADGLWHLARLASGAGYQIPVYAGLGVRAAAWHGNDWWWKGKYFYTSGGFDIAARAPVGVALWLKPVEVYLEAGPELWLLPPALDLFATLGFRLYF